MLNEIPKWLGTAVVGAVFSVLGFVAKWLWDWREKILKERSSNMSRLERLNTLLKASKAIYLIQHDILTNLTKLLEKNHKEIFRLHGGFEENLAICHGAMDAKEIELHGIIRSYTENSIKMLNSEMLAWLKEDDIFTRGMAPIKRKNELVKELFALEIHLMLWHAKYAFWLPNHPEHAVVFMEDENKHGLGFPHQVDAAVQTAVDQLRVNWR